MPRRCGEVAVRLVDEDEVGQLDDAFLDALQLVAASGQEQEQEKVRHARDRGLRLSDADRLDDDDVEAGRLADEHRLPRAARDAAERGPGRGGADTGLVVPGQLLQDRKSTRL